MHRLGGHFNWFLTFLRCTESPLLCPDSVPVVGYRGRRNTSPNKPPPPLPTTNTSAGNPEPSRISSFKPGEGQNVALHGLPAARSSAGLISTLAVYSTSFFFKHDVVYSEQWIRLLLVTWWHSACRPKTTFAVDKAWSIRYLSIPSKYSLLVPLISKHTYYISASYTGFTSNTKSQLKQQCDLISR